MRARPSALRPPGRRRRLRVAAGAVLTAAALSVGGVTSAASLAASGGAGAGSGTPGSSGGAALPGPAPTAQSRRHAAVQPSAPPATGAKAHWLHRVRVTEYWSAPEAWFSGALVDVPGLLGKHRIDWLYSARGVSMEGQGIGLDGLVYHIDQVGSGGWVTASGRRTAAARGWTGGPPFWRAGAYWQGPDKVVTFPLAAGGWAGGIVGTTYVPLPGVSFADGPALPVKPLQSIAVDPKVIPLGSRVYIPAYRNDGYGGWFIAQDTGGAIRGRHIDVYRLPPATPSTPGESLSGVTVYVVPPARSPGAVAH